MMMCLVVYWMIASIYGIIISYWRPEELAEKAVTTAKICGIDVETCWLIRTVIAGMFWPIYMPADVVYIIKKQ